MWISVGNPTRYSPVARKTLLMNRTRFSGSRTTIRGITVGQPLGWKPLICAGSPWVQIIASSPGPWQRQNAHGSWHPEDSYEAGLIQYLGGGATTLAEGFKSEFCKS